MKPKNDPTNVNGIEINSHIDKRTTRVPKGTAADEPFVHNIKLEMKKTVKTILKRKYINITKEKSNSCIPSKALLEN